MSTALHRRTLFRGSVAGLAWAMSRSGLSAFGFADAAAGEERLAFLDPPPVVPGHVSWDRQPDWLTAEKDTFTVSHYGQPKLDAEPFKLEITGLVERPLALSLAELKSRPKKEFTALLECGGNGAGPRFVGAVANHRWAGTPLAPLVKEARPQPSAIELVFFSADEGKENIRNNEYPQSFARSLSLSDAVLENVLLAYEMDGQPLTDTHGAPLRLVVPGWYGVAWVKWLTRVELHDRRFVGRFMGRDYVTIRGEEAAGKTIWRETLVGPLNPKSVIAAVTRQTDGALRISGAAWSDASGVKGVEVRIDDGAWQPAELEKKADAPFAWTFFHFSWKGAATGEHALVSRAIDGAGRVQPAADDPAIKLRKTYWEANEQFPRRVKV